MGKKIMVLSVNTWDDVSGNNTLQNIFSSFDPQDIYAIYLRSDLPNTKNCSHFFQISELACCKKILIRNLKCGKEVISGSKTSEEQSLEKQEHKVLKYYKKLNSDIVLLLRELIWKFGGWNEKALDEYIETCNPDYIFILVSSFVFSNRVAKYIIEKTNKPAILYFVDDNLSYKSISRNFLSFFFRYNIRKKIKSILPYTKEVFTISPMMKIEYDKLLKVNSVVLTKSVALFQNNVETKKKILKPPYRILYAGKLLYGRDRTLLKVAQYLSTLKNERVTELHIYTQTILENKLRSEFELTGVCMIHKAIPYDDLCKIQQNFDFLLFVESFKNKYKRIVRLSFSTKLTEYMATGKNIIAIGPKDIASIHYLLEKKCAFVITSENEIATLETLFSIPDIQSQIVHNAFDCIATQHSKQYIDLIMSQTLK